MLIATIVLVLSRLTRLLGLDDLQIRSLLTILWRAWLWKVLFILIGVQVLLVILSRAFPQLSLKIRDQALELLDFSIISVITDQCYQHLNHLEAKALTFVLLESVLSLKHGKIAKKFAQLMQGSFVNSLACLHPCRATFEWAGHCYSPASKRPEIVDRLLLCTLFLHEFAVAVLIFFSLICFQALSLDVFV